MTTFILFAISVFVLWRLYLVLGSNGGSKRPPNEQFFHRDGVDARQTDNVIQLPAPPRAPQANEPAPALEVDDVIDKMVPAGSALNEALRTIASADRAFDPQHFMAGAKAAYEMVVVAFAAADRTTLKMLLSTEVYAGFNSAIEDRQQRGLMLTTQFIGLDRTEIVEASLKAGLSQITVRFVSKLISVTTDRTGAVVDGDPQKVLEVTDLWTFAREVRSKDPNWKLVATGVDG